MLRVITGNGIAREDAALRARSLCVLISARMIRGDVHVIVVSRLPHGATESRTTFTSKLMASVSFLRFVGLQVRSHARSRLSFREDPGANLPSRECRHRAIS